MFFPVDFGFVVGFVVVAKTHLLSLTWPLHEVIIPFGQEHSFFEQSA